MSGTSKKNPAAAKTWKFWHKPTSGTSPASNRDKPRVQGAFSATPVKDDRMQPTSPNKPKSLDSTHDAQNHDLGSQAPSSNEQPPPPKRKSSDGGYGGLLFRRRVLHKLNNKIE